MRHLTSLRKGLKIELYFESYEIIQSGSIIGI